MINNKNNYFRRSSTKDMVRISIKDINNDRNSSTSLNKVLNNTSTNFNVDNDKNIQPFKKMSTSKELKMISNNNNKNKSNTSLKSLKILTSITGNETQPLSRPLNRKSLFSISNEKNINNDNNSGNLNNTNKNNIMNSKSNSNINIIQVKNEDNKRNSLQNIGAKSTKSLNVINETNETNALPSFNYKFNFVKLENFDFPIKAGDNLNYLNLKKLFEKLKEEYLNSNKLTNHHINITEIISKKIELFAESNTPTKNFMDIIQEYNFNTEELYLLNRIFFSLLLTEESNINFVNFYKQIKILVQCRYEDKLRVLLTFLDIYGNGFITKVEFNTLLVVMCVQSFDSKHNIESIIDRVFKDNIFLMKEDLFQICNESKEIMEVLKVILDINKIDS